MSNNPLALSALAAEPPEEPDYDAVYAAVTVTERGRWFLTEYAHRNRRAEIDHLVAAITRIEAAVCGAAPPQAAITTDSASAEPAEIAVLIERLAVAIEADRRAALDVAAAAEQIGDIAFGLRERAADSLLCDALDAAVRKINAAAAHSGTNLAAVHRESRAAAGDLLRELAGKIDALIKRARAGEAARPSPNRTADAAAFVAQALSNDADDDDPLSQGGLFDTDALASGNFAAAVASLAASLNLSGAETQTSVEPPVQTLGLMPEANYDWPVPVAGGGATAHDKLLARESASAESQTPESQAAQSTDAEQPASTPNHQAIEGPDFSFPPPQEPSGKPGAVRVAAQVLLPLAQLLPGLDDDPAESFAPSPPPSLATVVPEVAAAAPVLVAQATAPAPPEVPTAAALRAAEAAVMAQPHAAASSGSRDSLAPLRALSPDELAALFT